MAWSNAITDAERQTVCELLRSGLSTTEVADRVGRSTATVQRIRVRAGIMEVRFCAKCGEQFKHWNYRRCPACRPPQGGVDRAPAPTQAEIAERAEAVQRTWSESKRLKRAGKSPIVETRVFQVRRQNGRARLVF